MSHEPAKPDGAEVKIDPNEIHIDEQGNLKTAAELQAEIDRLQKLKEEKVKTENEPAEPLPISPSPEPPKIEIEPIAVTPAPVMPPDPLPPPPIVPPIEAVTPPVPSPHPDEHPPQHALLNPIEGRPTMSTPFTANTSDDSRPAWATGTFPAPVDPLNNPSISGHDQIFDHARTVSPASMPSPASTAPPNHSASPISVDHARNAVESALSAQPYDQDHPTPIQALGAQPMGPELHMPPPPMPAAPLNGSTPSLSLPTNGSPMPPPPTPPPLPPIPPVSR